MHNNNNLMYFFNDVIFGTFKTLSHNRIDSFEKKNGYQIGKIDLSDTTSNDSPKLDNL